MSHGGSMSIEWILVDGALRGWYVLVIDQDGRATIVPTHVAKQPIDSGPARQHEPKPDPSSR